MNIMIDHTSMQPIYEQITEQIKYQILHDTLQGGEALPSVHTLVKELKISALTNGLNVSHRSEWLHLS